MCLGFSKLLEKFLVKYVSTYTKGTLKKKRSEKGLYNDAYAMFVCVFFIFFIRTYIYVVDTHLNCINKLMLFKWVPATYTYYKEVDKKYTGYNLKTTELLDCMLTGVCAIIRSTTVVRLFASL